MMNYTKVLATILGPNVFGTLTHDSTNHFSTKTATPASMHSSDISH